MEAPLRDVQRDTSVSGGFCFTMNLVVVVLDNLIVVIIAEEVAHPVDRLARLSEGVSSLSFRTGCRDGINGRVSILKSGFGQVSSRLRAAVDRLGSTGGRLRHSVRSGVGVSGVQGRFLSGMSRRLGAPVTLVRNCTRNLGRGVSSSPRDERFCYSIVVSRTSGVGGLMGGLLALGRLRSNGSTIMVRQFSVMSLVHNILRAVGVVVKRGGTGIVFRTRGPICM